MKVFPPAALFPDSSSIAAGKTPKDVAGSGASCPFCSEDVIAVLANDHTYALFDKYPVSRGHLLVIPYRHVPDFF